MGVKYLETDITDEATIDWYDIDGETCGITSNGKILDSDGIPLVNETAARTAIETASRTAIEQYEAAK